MLARQHRVTSGDDYRAIVRRGTRGSGQHLTAFVAPQRDAGTPTRFGFIVSKRVGVAVVRNTLRRRLKAIAHELLHDLPNGLNIVFRVHPGADALSWLELRQSARTAVEKAVRRAKQHA